MVINSLKYVIMDIRTLFQLSADLVAIEDALWENGGELTPELELSMQETEASLAKKADGYYSLIHSFASKKDVIKAEIDRLAKLKKVAENAEKRIKQHICNTMGAFGIEKLEGNFVKFSRGKSTSTETDDDVLRASYTAPIANLMDALPPYLQVEIKVNKTALKEYIKETGITPNGVEFVENWSLRIR